MDFLKAFYYKNKGQLTCGAISVLVYFGLRYLTDDAFTDGHGIGRRQGYKEGQSRAVKDIADSIERRPDIFQEMLNDMVAAKAKSRK